MTKVSFKVSTQGSRKTLVYDIDNEASLDEDVLDMCENGDIGSVIPVEFVEDEDHDSFEYEISGKDTLDSYLSKTVEKAEMLSIIRNLSKIIVDFRESAIPISYLVFHRGFIYIDKNDLSLSFICIPIETADSTNVEISAFFRNILANSIYSGKENGDYVAKLLSYVNNKDNFTARGLISLVETLSKIEDNSSYVDSDDIALDDDDIVADYVEIDDENAQEEVTEETKETNNNDDSSFDTFAKDEPADDIVHNVEYDSLDLSNGRQEEYEDEYVDEQIDQTTGDIDDFKNQRVLSDEEKAQLEADEDAIAMAIVNEAKEAAKEALLEAAKREKERKEEEARQLEAQRLAEEEEARLLEEERLREEERLVREQEEALAKVSASILAAEGLMPETNNASDNQTDDEESSESENGTIPIIETEPHHQEFKLDKGIKVNRAKVIATVANVDEVEETEVTTQGAPESIEPASTSILSKTLPKMNMGGLVTGSAPKPMPYLIRVNTDERVMLNKPSFKLGKASIGMDYRISGNSAISRNHATIYLKDGLYFIKDNKSTNHTYVNGDIVDDAQDVMLTHDAKLMLGDEEFIFKLR